VYARRAISGGWHAEVNACAAPSKWLTDQAKAASQAGGVAKEPAVSNVIPFRARTPRIELRVAMPIPLYRLSVSRAKALGMCPDSANDTRTSGSRATFRESPAEDGTWVDDGLASLLELSIRNLVESRTGSRGS
jgi:hypothetical protein